MTKAFIINYEIPLHLSDTMIRGVIINGPTEAEAIERFNKWAQPHYKFISATPLTPSEQQMRDEYKREPFSTVGD